MRQVYYFDFEASTNGEKHKPYCVCCCPADKKVMKSFYGDGCAREFLEYLPDKALCYAHNLSYDINFILNLLTAVFEGSIIKGGKVYVIKGCYGTKKLTFKDTYCMISAPLKSFPKMFNLESGRKECFPYTYYTYPFKEIGDVREALKHIPAEDHELFRENVNAVARRKCPRKHEFNMKEYAVFYCSQDVRILCEGFEWFRSALLKEFNLDVYSFVSISSVANRLMEERCYWLNGNLYDLANTPREFISRCVVGGRCMLRDNEKQKSSGKEIVDFDAVSLYPSAIARLYTLEGLPKVLRPEMLSQEYLCKHLFTDDQLEPTRERFISGFFVEARIEKIGVPRHFPLIVYDPRWNRVEGMERAVNESCIMYMDHITFIDLIKFQQCKLVPVRGYYYDGARDPRCRKVIQELFELRAKYKKEGNPLQQVIKLLLNSVYGKTILKPIDTTIKFIANSEKDKYIKNRYHYIKEMSGTGLGNKFMSIEYKPYSKHFSFCTLGVNILSMSKRIMSEVMCTAEDLGIYLFYQDTDSMHLYKEDIVKLESEYKKRYDRELIGSQLGQFHSDFEPVNGDSNVVAVKSIFIMKKTYIDKLVNSCGAVAYHVRMKGIPVDVLVSRANELYSEIGYAPCTVKGGLVYQESDGEASVMKLYEDLYDGAAIEFDLAKDRACFDVRVGETVSKNSFVRRVGLNVCC